MGMTADMTTRKPLHIGLSLAPTWLSGDAWRQPGSNIEGLYSSDFALDLARRAEAAHLDFVFRPDVSFLPMEALETGAGFARDRKSTRLNSSHLVISYAVFCLKKKNTLY